MIGLIYVYVKQSDEFVEISCGKVSGNKETFTSGSTRVVNIGLAGI